MRTTIDVWLRESFEDFKRRWGSLMLVAGAGALATGAAAAVPLAPALALALAQAGPPWLIWGFALFWSLILGLWASTWGQAAIMRASARDEGGLESLKLAWPVTGAFAWTSTLLFAGAGGAFALLILPGFLLAGALFPGLYYHLDGEDEGAGALELSWARVMAAPGEAYARLLIAWLAAAAPAWIPWIGWIVGPLWAPFGLVASARLAADLKALTPAPVRPRLLRPALAFLMGLLALSTGAAGWGAYRLYLSAREVIAHGGLPAPNEPTKQALLNVLRGQADPEQQKLAFEYALALTGSSETLKGLFPEPVR